MAVITPPGQRISGVLLLQLFWNVVTAEALLVGIHTQQEWFFGTMGRMATVAPLFDRLVADRQSKDCFVVTFKAELRRKII